MHYLAEAESVATGLPLKIAFDYTIAKCSPGLKPNIAHRTAGVVHGNSLLFELVSYRFTHDANEKPAAPPIA